MNYWLPRHQTLIEKYYYCQTGITSGQTCNECITKLLPVLEEIIGKALWSVGIPKTEENVQDCLIRIATHILPKIKEDKLKASLFFIWQSIRNYLINQQVVQHMQYDELEDTLIDTDNNPDHNLELEDLRIRILKKIDRKIQYQKVVNKTATIFLINMKEYIITNNYDVRGFNEWIQNKMNIKKTTYNSLISRVGISSKVFNEKLIKDKE